MAFQVQSTPAGSNQNDKWKKDQNGAFKFQIQPNATQIWENQQASKNSGSGGSSGSSSSYSESYYPPYRDYYAELMAAIEARAEAQRQAKIAAIDSQLNSQLGAYDEQMAALEPLYQQYRNQSEVERYKAQKSLREALANRGALDSGAGRQETLDLQNNYGNNLTKINLQQQAEIDAINRAKQQLRAEAEFQKQQVSADIDNVGLEAKIAALQAQIADQQSRSRSAATTYSSSQSNSQIGKSAVTDAVASTTKGLSERGSAFYNSMQKIAQASGRQHTAYEVQEALRQGYEQGVLNETDVETIKKLYGY